MSTCGIVKSQYHRLLTRVKGVCKNVLSLKMLFYHPNSITVSRLRCIWPELNVFSYGKMAGFFSGRAMTSNYIEKGARF